jgi:Family of unknown function (DUF6262)
MSRADNTQYLLQAARQRSGDARKRTMQAIADLAAAGQPVTPTTVARKAGVSRQWLYTFPDAHDAMRGSPSGSPPPVAASSAANQASWQRRVEALSDENQRLRRKVKELEDLVARLYGLRRSECWAATPRS